MVQIFGIHNNCISNVLSSISCKYKDKKIFLDIGCGYGDRTILFDGYGRIICGVDRTRILVDSVRNRINFKQEDFMEGHLSYENEYFDIIFSFDVLEHLQEPNVMLREIYRLLKKDGVFILSTPNRNRWMGVILYSLKIYKLPRYLDKAHIGLPYARHETEYTLAELESLVNNEGFTVVKKHKIFYGIPGKYGFKYLLSLPLFHNILFECKKIEGL